MSQPTLPFSSSTLTARGLYQQFSELETQVQSSKSVTNQQVQQLIALQSQTIQFLSQRPGKQTQESLSSSASSGTVGYGH